MLSRFLLFYRLLFNSEHRTEYPGKEFRAFQYNDLHMYAPFIV